MPEETADSQGQEQKGPATPMISKRGWLIVIAVVVLEAVVFGIIMAMRSADPAEAAGKEAAVQTIPADYLDAYNVEITDIAHSVPGPGTTTRTLSVNLIVSIGLLPEEIEDESKRPNPQQMQKFQETVRRLTPLITAEFLKIVDKYNSVSQLNKTETKEAICRQLAKFINDKLDRMEFKEMRDLKKRRILGVEFTRFYTDQ